MAQHDRAALVWRKSSRSSGIGGSGNGGGCVEIAFDTTGPVLRDSKQGNHSPILAVGRAQFDALLDTIRG